MPLTNLVFENASEDFVKGVHQPGHTYKLALTNTEPNIATVDSFDDITEISAGNGYTAGGYTLANVAITRTGAVTKFDADDITIAASGGSIGPFQWGVLYNDTATGNNAICKISFESATTVVDGDSPVLRFNVDGVVSVTGNPA
jgi:hypothetical protein